MKDKEKHFGVFFALQCMMKHVHKPTENYALLPLVAIRRTVADFTFLRGGANQSKGRLKYKKGANIHCESKKLCQPNHGYNFVNF